MDAKLFEVIIIIWIISVLITFENYELGRLPICLQLCTRCKIQTHSSRIRFLSTFRMNRFCHRWRLWVIKISIEFIHQVCFMVSWISLRSKQILHYTNNNEKNDSSLQKAGLILSMGPINERRRYNIMSSLIPIMIPDKANPNTWNVYKQDSIQWGRDKMAAV